jgi:hypothetical protein
VVYNRIEVSSFLASGFSHSPPTTVVGGGGGLNKYQPAAGDGLQPCIFKG